MFTCVSGIDLFFLVSVSTAEPKCTSDLDSRQAETRPSSSQHPGHMCRALHQNFILVCDLLQCLIAEGRAWSEDICPAGPIWPPSCGYGGKTICQMKWLSRRRRGLGKLLKDLLKLEIMYPRQGSGSCTIAEALDRDRVPFGHYKELCLSRVSYNVPYMSKMSRVLSRHLCSLHPVLN